MLGSAKNSTYPNSGRDFEGQVGDERKFGAHVRCDDGWCDGNRKVTPCLIRSDQGRDVAWFQRVGKFAADDRQSLPRIIASKVGRRCPPLLDRYLERIRRNSCRSSCERCTRLQRALVEETIYLPKGSAFRSVPGNARSYGPVLRRFGDVSTRTQSYKIESKGREKIFEPESAFIDEAMSS